MQQETDFKKFLEMTLAVYKVTDLFPKEGRELQFQIRKSANQILIDLLLSRNVRVNNLLELFQMAAGKDWINPRNFLVLRKEYAKLQGLFPNNSKANNVQDLVLSLPPKTAEFNNGRQKTIFNILKEKKKIQLRDITPSFPQVSRRTLIRDLEELCQTGLVIKNGNGPGTSYIVT